MHRSLASVAELEFNTLVQDTKSAVGGLKRQRESVAQAISAAQQANGRSECLSGETAIQLAHLLDRLNRLEATLDQVICEVEVVETAPIPSYPEVLPTWSYPPSGASQPPLPRWLSRVYQWRESLLKVLPRNFAPFANSCRS